MPPRLRDRVVRGEYVDFSELLPSSLSHQHEQCAITLPLGDGHANSVQLAVTTQRPARRTVCDFSAWLEAWTVYLSTVKLGLYVLGLVRTLGYNVRSVDHGHRQSENMYIFFG